MTNTHQTNCQLCPFGQLIYHYPRYYELQAHLDYILDLLNQIAKSEVEIDNALVVDNTLDNESELTVDEIYPLKLNNTDLVHAISTLKQFTTQFLKIVDDISSMEK